MRPNLRQECLSCTVIGSFWPKMSSSGRRLSDHFCHARNCGDACGPGCVKTCTDQIFLESFSIRNLLIRPQTETRLCSAVDITEYFPSVGWGRSLPFEWRARMRPPTSQIFYAAVARWGFHTAWTHIDRRAGAQHWCCRSAFSSSVGVVRRKTSVP